MLDAWIWVKGTDVSAEPMTTSHLPRRVQESVLKRALKPLAWDELEQHLLGVRLDGDGVAEMLGHIRRSSDFIMRRADAGRQAKRSAFLSQLAIYLSTNVDADAAASLAREMSLIERIETGYREIMRAQEGTAAAKLAPEIQAAAALRRAAQAYQKMTEEVEASLSRRKELGPQSLRVERTDGSTYAPDGVLAGIVAGATKTLQLLGHRHGWFDGGSTLVLPTLPEATDDEAYKAGLTELLAASWRHWERMEQRCRYFGGEMKVFTAEALPEWVPEGAETAIEYHLISAAQVDDYVANERLNERMVQIYVEMMLRSTVADKEAGIDGPVELFPAAVVSVAEAHAGNMLGDLLGYAIAGDQERPGGLRLVQWVRGYAALKCLADERYGRCGRKGLYFTVSREILVGLLDRVGLKDGAAERFIDEVSFRASSRDLFDHPLLRMQDGSVLVFGPSILNADPARVTLSAIGKEERQLGRKGKAFEAAMLRFFERQGLKPRYFKFTRNGEEFQYDVVVPWEDHVFVLECKNRTLSGHNPVAAYYFALEVESGVRQVRRLADALTKHADAVLERSGIDVAGKTVVPCLVNCMPYASKGKRDGVYVTDASGLRRFFEKRDFHVVRAHNLGGKGKVLHRTGMKRLWKGATPTAADLMAYLDDPFQLRLMAAHLRKEGHGFGLGERTVVGVADVLHDEMSAESTAKVFGIDGKWVEREARDVTRAIGAARKANEWRSVRQAERAWREQQKRKPRM